MIPNPNVGGFLRQPRFVVLHYTVSGSFESTAAWLRTPASKASAHYLIGREGQQEQLVSLDRVAWHAGQSKYKGLQGLNSYSIGIELISWGPLVRVKSADEYRAAVAPAVIPDDEVIEALHPDNPNTYGYWHKISDQQIATLKTTLKSLFEQFPSLREVVGHHMIAPGRKWDPWPLNCYEVNKLFGKDESDRVITGGQVITLEACEHPADKDANDEADEHEAEAE